MKLVAAKLTLEGRKLFDDIAKQKQLLLHLDQSLAQVVSITINQSLQMQVMLFSAQSSVQTLHLQSVEVIFRECKYLID